MTTCLLSQTLHELHLVVEFTIDNSKGTKSMEQTKTGKYSPKVLKIEKE